MIADFQNYEVSTKVPFIHSPAVQEGLAKSDHQDSSTIDGEETHRQFIFRIRFIKYLTSAMRFSQIDFNKRRQKRIAKTPLVFDTPVGESKDIKYGELIQLEHIQNDQEMFVLNTEQFLAQISDERVHHAITQLTSKQKEIIALSYGCDEYDVEIAKRLGVSPQAVCKSRKSAIYKLRKIVTTA